MKTFLKAIALTIGSFGIMSATTQAAKAAEPQNTVNMEISSGGTVTIELLPDIAPKAAERIKTLARDGFYNGITFHRVMRGFMAQAGDPTGTGMHGSDYEDLPAEFSNYAYKRGTVGMARTFEPDSANSQFFICFDDHGCRTLTGQYTVVGQVTAGMEYVDAIAIGEPPSNPTKIIKMTVAADTQKPAE